LTENNALKHLQTISSNLLVSNLSSTERMKTLDQCSDVHRLDRRRSSSVHLNTAVGCRGNSSIFYLAEAEVAVVLKTTSVG
jgi:hypothetical protein